ncbi:BlaI/MecI/CopY family transcriptional regulator [Pseudonocardia alni]|uniref:BlaI/MecI/CopY family transcriptional regulator n=1 Tax=Pseudonocardia alni TaxID=33907 RepID=UPI003680E5A6
MTGEVRSGLAGTLGPLELAILESVWRSGEVDVAHVVRDLGEGSAYSTVKTVMERLVGKGLLARRKQSRLYLYWATRSRAEVEDEVSARQVQRVIEGFGDMAVAHFVRSVRDDPARLRRVRDLLESLPDDEVLQ